MHNVRTSLVLLLTVSAIGFIPQYKIIRESSSFQKTYAPLYVEQFKLTYFKQLLLKSYNHSGAVQEIMHLDHSGFTEPLLTENDYKLIDSLTTLDNVRLVADSTGGYRRAEGAGGKRTIGFILGLLESKRLDQLAKERFREFAKGQRRAN